MVATRVVVAALAVVRSVLWGIGVARVDEGAPGVTRVGAGAVAETDASATAAASHSANVLRSPELCTRVARPTYSHQWCSNSWCRCRACRLTTGGLVAASLHRGAVLDIATSVAASVVRGTTSAAGACDCVVVREGESTVAASVGVV